MWILAAGIAAVLGSGAFGAWWLLRDGNSTPDTTVAAVTTITTELVTTTEPPPSTTAATTTTAPITTNTTTVAPAADPWEATTDQWAVAGEFGAPSTFTILFGEDPDDPTLERHRIEYWDYLDMGVRFMFRDGVVVGTRTIARLGLEYDYPALTPDLFYDGMTYEAIVDLMGFEPTHAGQLVPSIYDKFAMLIWDGCVAVSFEDGVIASVQTSPVEVAG